MIPSVLDVADLPVSALPERIMIPALTVPFDVSITPPGSKSLTNRALLLAALASGRSVLTRPLTEADDAARMITALSSLGARIEPDGVRLNIEGVAGRWNAHARETRLDLGNAGTATRFLAAAAVLTPPGTAVVIDGNARMRQRPIGELTEPLRLLDATVENLGSAGFPPLRIRMEGPAKPAKVVFGATASSQFVSAVLLVAPFVAGGVTVGFTDPNAITSRSYIDMTLGLLRQLGATVTGSVEDGLHVAGSFGRIGLRAFEYTVEPDASGATTFLAAAALVPTARCRIVGLGPSSLQGDTEFASVLAKMGPQRDDREDSIGLVGVPLIAPVDVSLADMPDTAMNLAVVCAFAAGTSRLRGLATLRVKETDRLAALVAELSKIGTTLRVERDGAEEHLLITPRSNAPASAPGGDPIEFETYDDHRMAMALSLVGLRGVGRPVVIKNPACVAKTYPTFWRELAALYSTQNPGV